MQRRIIQTIFLLLVGSRMMAQDSSLMKMMDDAVAESQQGQLVTGTFKATQIVNLPTVESPGKKSLQFMIMHRFGKLNGGAYEFFGLDNASIRFALDYGITDRFSVGLGRSSGDKTFDGSLKYKLLQQKEVGMPISVSLYGLITNYTQRYSDKPYLDARYRTSYTTQVLIAKKFSPAFSFEVVPSWIHNNLVPTPEDKSDLFAVSAGGRLKFTKRMSVNAEYNYLLRNQVVSTKVYDAISGGIDIETGGHVFQLVFTNAAGMVGPYYLAKTDGSWGKGDIYFGFNITRNFNFKK
ncbi:DUF5777 family beta-barrel protein [Chitinophaga sancti]|uniref:DUF5777 family beta-barrel protein n=1 Tax=Chitinophaga sancti TaxID=1004 RepID=A0A1K1LSN7_9BACT|nr:DUF5777 family beta-barrel protein [Chitinophaga sancti]WQD64965.1 DUF5777 family beta-barrel protein [Chitinophaga sancti]WQG89411.1 DUF5777 family beta-barrel protein [Chitinophaga sancti]SFW12662.1 hypothetical protein SAMN05661012_00096 [Chitinophaga sancti]